MFGARKFRVTGKPGCNYSVLVTWAKGNKVFYQFCSNQSRSAFLQRLRKRKGYREFSLFGKF